MSKLYHEITRPLGELIARVEEISSTHKVNKALILLHEALAKLMLPENVDLPIEESLVIFIFATNLVIDRAFKEKDLTDKTAVSEEQKKIMDIRAEVLKDLVFIGYWLKADIGINSYVELPEEKNLRETVETLSITPALEITRPALIAESLPA